MPSQWWTSWEMCSPALASTWHVDLWSRKGKQVDLPTAHRRNVIQDRSAFISTNPKSMSNELPELAERLQQLHRRIIFQLVALEFAAV